MKKEIRMVETGSRAEGKRGMMLPMVWGVGQAAIAARVHEAETVREDEAPTRRVRRCRETRRSRAASLCAQAEPVASAERETDVQPERDLAMYRKYAEALLRRYQRLKLQASRPPSPMSREIFRGKMSHYRVEGFDDAVIFCVDVERCLARLNAGDERLVRRIAMQEYSMGEAAAVLGMSLRSCFVLYSRALDRVTRMFLTSQLLSLDESCQEATQRSNELSS